MRNLRLGVGSPPTFRARETQVFSEPRVEAPVLARDFSWEWRGLRHYPARLSGVSDFVRARIGWREARLGLALLALFALWSWQLWLVSDFRIDDAYITFSFSKNLAEGNGPVFSNGERVEGYSNFLWMVLNALTRVVLPAVDPYIPGRVLSFAALFATALAVYRLARRSSGVLSALMALCLMAACTDLTRAAMSALETIPFTAAITWGWYLHLQGTPEARARSRWVWLSVLLLRIDGFVPFLALLGFDVLESCAARRFSLQRLVRWLWPILLLYALYFTWRYTYYGLPLPTTYYAKSMVRVEEPLLGYDQLWFFARDYGAIALLPFMVLPVLRGPRRVALGAWTALLSQLAYFAMVGGDWMPFERFFQPIVPLGALLAGAGFERAYQELRALPAALRVLTRLALLAPLSFSAVHMHGRHSETREEKEKLTMAAHTARHTRENLLGAVDLMRFMLREPGERLATDYAGVFAVHTDATIIDMWGLCNEDIALHGGIEGIHAIYGKQCPSCVLRADPDYFHVYTPIVRDAHAFNDEKSVKESIFLWQQLDPVLNLRDNFAVGRVLDDRGRALWFLERRRPGRSLARRHPALNITVDYPFERRRR